MRMRGKWKSWCVSEASDRRPRAAITVSDTPVKVPAHTQFNVKYSGQTNVDVYVGGHVYANNNSNANHNDDTN